MIDERLRHLESIRGYIDKVLFPAIRYNGPYTVKPATAGVNSYVYFLEAPSLDHLVLRGETNKSSLLRRIRGHEIMLRHGFDVPEIVYQDLSPIVRQKFGFYFLVESKMPGVFFNDEANDPDITGARLGEVLARMHEFTSWRYGRPGEWRWWGNIVTVLQLGWEMRSLLKDYKKSNDISSKVIAKWLRKNFFCTRFLRPRLTTGGYIPSNVLVDKDRVVIIDLAKVRYAFAARDIAQVHYSLFRNDPKAISAFSRAYRQHASKTLLKEIDKTLPMLKILFILQKALREKNMIKRAELDQELLRYSKAYGR